ELPAGLWIDLAEIRLRLADPFGEIAVRAILRTIQILNIAGHPVKSQQALPACAFADDLKIERARLVEQRKSVMPENHAMSLRHQAQRREFGDLRRRSFQIMRRALMPLALDEREEVLLPRHQVLDDRQRAAAVDLFVISEEGERERMQCGDDL